MIKGLRAYVNSIKERDPAARNALEVLTCYPGVHAILLHRVSHWLWQRGWRGSARWLAFLSRWLTGIEIHPAAIIGRNVFIDHGMGVVIGETAVVGDGSTLYHGVTLGGRITCEGKRHPTLGQNVVVGAGAKVLGPITIGDSARIGANAVVLHDVPEGATMVGVPAREVSSPLAMGAYQMHSFAPYGVNEDLLDPVVVALEQTKARMSKLERQLEQIERLLDHSTPARGTCREQS